MFEMMIKQLMKNVDFEKLQSDLLNDPRVREALDLAGSIRDDFQAIKNSQAEIHAKLDLLIEAAENTSALANDSSSKPKQPKKIKAVSAQTEE